MALLCQIVNKHRPAQGIYSRLRDFQVVFQRFWFARWPPYKPLGRLGWWKFSCLLFLSVILITPLQWQARFVMLLRFASRIEAITNLIKKLFDAQVRSCLFKSML